MRQIQLPVVKNLKGEEQRYCSNKQCKQINPQPIKEFHKRKCRPSGYGSRCRSCVKKYYSSKKRQDILKNRYLEKTHDLKTEDYEKMLKDQNYECKICSKKTIELKTKLHIDHNHLTGKIRGLLCSKCNIGIGYFDTDKNIDLLLKAIEYIRKTQ